MASELAPWRCSVCGKATPPDTMRVWAPEDRYAFGTCSFCHQQRQLVRAVTVGEATREYRDMVESRERAKRAREQLEHGNSI